MLNDAELTVVELAPNPRCAANHFFRMTLTKKAEGKRTTPAMAAGLAKTVWTVEQMLQRMDAIFVL